MLSQKDIEFRSVFLINGSEHKALKIINGNLSLINTETNKALTKLPFQKIFAIIVVGNISITSPLIEKCNAYNIAIIVTKFNFRPVFFYTISAEGNFLLRKKQYEFNKLDSNIAKKIIDNKIINQLQLIKKMRGKDEKKQRAIMQIESLKKELINYIKIDEIMGIEGMVSKIFFIFYFEKLNWQRRSPRTKIDCINTCLDIGYTILFNFIECMIRMFGFDPYIGVYHQLWFQRKSLVCDLVEPFRCLIDEQIRKSFNLGQFSVQDFEIYKNAYYLKKEKNKDYQKIFFEILADRKKEIFIYIKNYYLYFMQRKSVENYIPFNIN